MSRTLIHLGMPIKDREESKVYQNKWYQDNKEEHDRRLKLKRSVMRRIIQEIKLNAPCADCGIPYPHYVLQFDHLPVSDKKFNISSTPQIPSVIALLAEIEKCELVCANCHAARSYTRYTKNFGPGVDRVVLEDADGRQIWKSAAL